MVNLDAIKKAQALCYEKLELDKWLVSQTTDLLLNISECHTMPYQSHFFSAACITSVMMGPNSTINVAGGWSEPPLLWVILAAPISSGKSAVFKYFRREVGKAIAADCLHPDAILEEFTPEALNANLCERDGVGLCNLDEFQVFLNNISKGKGDNSEYVNTTQYLSMYDGEGINKQLVKQKLSIPSTRFVMTGAFQPELADKFLAKEDSTGFNERFWVVFPQPRLSTWENDVAPGFGGQCEKNEKSN